jgi:abortive infection alpha-like protein
MGRTGKRTPAENSGVWLTIISPITQWAALKADQLAHKRELLRLQQEETLTEIATRVRARIKAKRLEKPVPIKFLVPFLEKASLEEPDSELVNLWAALLVSAAEDYDPHFIHFTNIISQMSGRQAQIFIDVIATDAANELDLSLEALWSGFLHNFLQGFLSQNFKSRQPKPNTLEAMWQFLEEALNNVGTEIVHVELEDLNEGKIEIGSIPGSNYLDERETDFAILDAIGLIRYVDTGYFNLSARWRMKVVFYYVTKLGRDFAKACGITK